MSHYLKVADTSGLNVRTYDFDDFISCDFTFDSFSSYSGSEFPVYWTGDKTLGISILAEQNITTTIFISMAQKLVKINGNQTYKVFDILGTNSYGQSYVQTSSTGAFPTGEHLIAFIIESSSSGGYHLPSKIATTYFYYRSNIPWQDSCYSAITSFGTGQQTIALSATASSSTDNSTTAVNAMILNTINRSSTGLLFLSQLSGSPSNYDILKVISFVIY